MNDEAWEEEPFLLPSPYSPPWELLGVDEGRNVSARFFTLLPQLPWQRIPPAPGSHRPHKLIRHLLESSADGEAGRFTANIFVRDDSS